MTPRQKIFSLPSNMLLEEASAKVIARHHSRVPVYDETRGPEHIVGVVYAEIWPGSCSSASERCRYALSPRRLSDSETWSRSHVRPAPPPFVELQLSQVMRDVLVVPETKSVLDLIRDFQQRRRHMAIVVDEYGSTVGLVTAEDAIEQLTGELEDEFDSPAAARADHRLRRAADGWRREPARPGNPDAMEPAPRRRRRNPRRIPAHAPRPHPPALGESITFEGRRLTVVEMEGRRIGKVRVESAEDQEAENKLNSGTRLGAPESNRIRYCPSLAENRQNITGLLQKMMYAVPTA